jgi:hypothetical protein
LLKYRAQIARQLGFGDMNLRHTVDHTPFGVKRNVRSRIGV